MVDVAIDDVLTNDEIAADMRKTGQIRWPTGSDSGEYPCGNIYVRPNVLLRVHDFTQGHTHTFDHVSYVIHGAVYVRGVHPDGSVIEGDFYAGQWFLVLKDVEHFIIAIEPRTVYHCLYSHRNPQGDVVQEYDGWTSKALGNYV